MYDPQDVVKPKINEVPVCANYTVGKENFELASKAEVHAIKEIGKSFTKSGVVIHDDNGRVYATVCRIKDGVLTVYADGKMVKYTGITCVYSKDGSEMATVAICRGMIVQL